MNQRWSSARCRGLICWPGCSTVDDGGEGSQVLMKSLSELVVVLRSKRLEWMKGREARSDNGKWKIWSRIATQVL